MSVLAAGGGAGPSAAPIPSAPLAPPASAHPHGGPASAPAARPGARQPGDITASSPLGAVGAVGTAAELAGCPIFPANNVWNTDISKLPVGSHCAARLRSLNSGSTHLHPDLGPNAGGSKAAAARAATGTR